MAARRAARVIVCVLGCVRRCAGACLDTPTIENLWKTLRRGTTSPAVFFDALHGPPGEFRVDFISYLYTSGGPHSREQVIAPRPQRQQIWAIEPGPSKPRTRYLHSLSRRRVIIALTFLPRALIIEDSSELNAMPIPARGGAVSRIHLRMTLRITNEAVQSDFKAEVERRLGQKVSDCYQCGKCTAGCPMAWDMDLAPNHIVRMVQLGRRERVLACKTIWVCASCETCSARCPKDFDVAGLMDVLREMSLAAGLNCPEADDIVAFHKSFLNSIKRHGRPNEAEMVAEYKLRSRHLFQDVANAVRMALRGKIKPVPKSIKGKAAVRKIFEKCRRGKNRSSERT